jgi:hypothetical protein
VGGQEEVMNEKRSIYQALEQALREAKEPLSARELLSNDDVQQAARESFNTADRVQWNRDLSNTLAYLWRKGLINRVPVSIPGTRSQYAYSCREPLVPSPAPFSSRKPTYYITESEDSVSIEFENFAIIVKRK